jgi:hypothetical protein
MKYLPVKLQLWEHPTNYYGETWEGHYVFLWQTRDSDALARSNFTCALEQIGKGIAVSHERHWACGWIETILIPEDNYNALRVADEIMRKLEDYPVLNEDHFSQLEYEEQDYEDWRKEDLEEALYEARTNQ